jgi:hypothetical protein
MPSAWYLVVPARPAVASLDGVTPGLASPPRYGALRLMGWALRLMGSLGWALRLMGSLPALQPFENTGPLGAYGREGFFVRFLEGALRLMGSLPALQPSEITGPLGAYGREGEWIPS